MAAKNTNWRNQKRGRNGRFLKGVGTSRNKGISAKEQRRQDNAAVKEDGVQLDQRKSPAAQARELLAQPTTGGSKNRNASGSAPKVASTNPPSANPAKTLRKKAQGLDSSHFGAPGADGGRKLNTKGRKALGLNSEGKRIS